MQEHSPCRKISYAGKFHMQENFPLHLLMVHSGYLNFSLTMAHSVVCVFCGTGFQEGCQWASVVWLAHHKHFQQPGGAECECCITSAGGQRQSWQNHVWPGQHTLHVLQPLLAFTAQNQHQHASIIS